MADQGFVGPRQALVCMYRRIRNGYAIGAV